MRICIHIFSVMLVTFLLLIFIAPVLLDYHMTALKSICEMFSSEADPLHDISSHSLTYSLWDQVTTIKKLISLWLSDTIWRQRSWSSLVQAMAFCLISAKPLSEPMLTYCKIGTSEDIQMKYWFEIMMFSFKLFSDFLQYISHLVGLVQICRISIAKALEILQFCNKPSICVNLNMLWYLPNKQLLFMHNISEYVQVLIIGMYQTMEYASEG